MDREKLKALYTEYGLNESDVFVQKLGGKSIPTVTRTGVEKIQGKLKVKLNYNLEAISDNHNCVVVKCIGTNANGETLVESYGEASPDNCKQKYPVAMAEKRAKARVVLQIAGFYQQGVYSEDEF